MEVLKQNFNFQSIKKKEAITNFLNLRLTNQSKNLKSNHFLPFLTENMVLISFKCGISNYTGLKGYLRYKTSFCNRVALDA